MKKGEKFLAYLALVGLLIVLTILIIIREQIIAVGPWLFGLFLACVGLVLAWLIHKLYVSARKEHLSLQKELLAVEEQKYLVAGVKQNLKIEFEQHELNKQAMLADIHVKLSRLQADPNGNYPVLIPGRIDLLPSQMAGNVLSIPAGQAPRVRVQEEKNQQLLLNSGAQLPGPCTLSQSLTTFQPTLQRILLGFLAGGEPVFSDAEGLCHVAVAGATGGGKSVIERLLLAQLCKAGARILLLNPHYTRWDRRAKDPAGRPNPEDWTPFTPYLLADPMECRHYDVIAHYLKEVADKHLPRRLEKYAHSLPLGKPLFLVLDEIPAIIAHVKDAPDYLAFILREGRKVGIFVISASQDFLVKTIAPQGGGAVRDCYRTAIYVGGDPTTARTLLDIKGSVDDGGLGKGVVMLRGGQAKNAQLARVPYVDNQALYDLLGPSTFVESELVDEDDENEDEIGVQRKAVYGAPGTPRYVEAEAETGDDRDVPFNTLDGDSEAARNAPSNVRAFPVSPMQVPADESDATSEERPKEYRLTEIEIGQFLAAYRVSGSIDKALAAIGKGTRYRQHAREILAAHNARQA